MSLYEIKDKLYKKDFDPGESRHGQSEFDARQENPALSEKISPPGDAWAPKKEGLSEDQKKAVKWGVIALGAISVFTVSVFAVINYIQGSFREERVAVSIEGPQQADSGKFLIYEINFKNDNRDSLEDAVLRVNYPEGFRPEQSPNFEPEGETTGSFRLGKIPGGGAGKLVLNGRAYSPRGESIVIKANLNYMPSSLSSTFSARNQIVLDITSSPVDLEIMAPQNMASGDALDYLITYKNNGQKDMENLIIRMDYPGGFVFSTASPKVSESDNVWHIGRLSAGQEGKIVVSGKMEGARDEIKNARVFIGVAGQNQFSAYSESKTETKIAASPLSISQLVNNKDSLVANAGETLRFQIEYKNESDVGYRDVIVTEKLQSPVLDYTTLQMKGGTFDQNNSMITWKASDYPQLKFLGPGQGGMIDFSIRIKAVIPVENANDRNFVISSVAKIDSADIPTPIQMNKIVAGNKIDIKVNSKLILDAKGFYNDSLIPNSGPIPPVSGQETTYTIRWKTANVSNEVTGARVEAVLPTGVTYAGKLSPEGAHLTYNERNNSIIWDLGTLAAGSGIINTSPEVAFQVKFVPSPNQIGSTPDLIGSAVFSAKDAFTGENLSFVAEKKTTALREDEGIGFNYKVTAR